MKRLSLILICLFVFSPCHADVSHWAGEEIGVDISHWADEEFDVDISAWAGESVPVGSTALTFVAGASYGADSGSAPYCTHGITILAGDLVIVVVEYNQAGPYCDDNNGSDYLTEVRDDSTGTSSGRAFYWTEADASEPDTYYFTLTASVRWSVNVVVFRPPSGLSLNANPFDVAPTAPDTGESDTVQANSDTGTMDHVTWLAIAHIDGSSVTFTDYPDDPNGYSEAVTHTLNQPCSIYYKEDQGAGATSNETWTTSISNKWGGDQVILKPAE